MKTITLLFIILCFLFGPHIVWANTKIDKKLSPTKPCNKVGKDIVCHLTVDYKQVSFAGKKALAMVVNNSLPAPTLYFEEGRKAIIYVTNKMDVDTSIHWHGILLPNFQDGVPYLTTPPIKPNTTHKFEFVLKQSGTYWYHSHTGLQEQKGIYGAIVVEPKKLSYKYDHELVLVLSDWTNEDPNQILRTLKRGSEWYAIKKGSALSLLEVIANGAFMAQMSLWWQKMPGMDISDVYYPAFLINGAQTQHYDFKPGSKVRLRIVNASASTYFWLSFGGDLPLLISADGINIKPLNINKMLMAIAETYDLIITMPKKNALEIKAQAQDGSGQALVTMGKGPVLKAPIITKPDPIEEIKKMANMHAGHTEHEDHKEHKEHKKHIGHTEHKDHKEHKKHEDHSDHKKHAEHKAHTGHSDKKAKPSIKQKNLTLTYDKLRGLQKTSFPKSNTVRDIHLNLTGNMWRYVWSMNGKTLSEVDIIQVKKGETLRLNLHNTTMMHHPMHLHGHFFRVLNQTGEYSPLKHTVDVSPHQTVKIEFAPDIEGDWMFHCHVLYHMKSGMSRVFRNGDKRDNRLEGYPLSKALSGDSAWYHFAQINMMSNMFDMEIISSNVRNKITLEGAFSWVDEYYDLHKKFEAEISYEHFVGEFFRLYVGGDIENKEQKNWEELKNYDISGKMGFRYLLPLFIDLDMSVDHKLRFNLELEYELLLFPRIEFLANYEWKVDFGVMSPLKSNKNWEQEHEFTLGLNYILSQDVSLTASYSNHFSYGLGLNLKL